MSDIIDKYLNFIMVEKSLARNSLKCYHADLLKLSQFAKSLGKPLQDLGNRDLSEFIKSLAMAGLSPRSISRAISSVRGLYAFLRCDGFILADPTANLHTHKVDKPLPSFLTEAEIDLLLEAPDLKTLEGIRDRALLELMYATGMRVSEVANVKLVDINLNKGVLSCYGKGGKQRFIPLSRSSILFLEKYLIVRPKLTQERSTDAVFVIPKGQKLSRQGIWLLIRKYAKLQGLGRVTPHTLRHSFATHLTNRGADSRSVQSLLGHSDLATTQIYVHITNLHLRDSYDNSHPRARIPDK